MWFGFHEKLYIYIYVYSNITCGENNILGYELMIHNGELGKFNLVYSCHSISSSSPVEFNVICSVTICEREQRTGIIEDGGVCNC